MVSHSDLCSKFPTFDRIILELRTKGQPVFFETVIRPAVERAFGFRFTRELLLELLGKSGITQFFTIEWAQIPSHIEVKDLDNRIRKKYILQSPSTGKLYDLGVYPCTKDGAKMPLDTYKATILQRCNDFTLAVSSNPNPVPVRLPTLPFTTIVNLSSTTPNSKVPSLHERTLQVARASSRGDLSPSRSTVRSVVTPSRTFPIAQSITPPPSTTPLISRLRRTPSVTHSMTPLPLPSASPSPSLSSDSKYLRTPAAQSYLSTPGSRYSSVSERNGSRGPAAYNEDFLNRIKKNDSMIKKCTFNADNLDSEQKSAYNRIMARKQAARQAMDESHSIYNFTTSLIKISSALGGVHRLSAAKVHEENSRRASSRGIEFSERIDASDVANDIRTCIVTPLMDWFLQVEDEKDYLKLDELKREDEEKMKQGVEVRKDCDIDRTVEESVVLCFDEARRKRSREHRLALDVENSIFMLSDDEEEVEAENEERETKRRRRETAIRLRKTDNEEHNSNEIVEEKTNIASSKEEEDEKEKEQRNLLSLVEDEDDAEEGEKKEEVTNNVSKNSDNEEGPVLEEEEDERRRAVRDSSKTIIRQKIVFDDEEAKDDKEHIKESAEEDKENTEQKKSRRMSIKRRSLAPVIVSATQLEHIVLTMAKTVPSHVIQSNKEALITVAASTLLAASSGKSLSAVLIVVQKIILFDLNNKKKLHEEIQKEYDSFMKDNNFVNPNALISIVDKILAK